VAAAIELDAETRSELERRAASLTLPYRVVVRAKLVLLAADGRTNREIAEPWIAGLASARSDASKASTSPQRPSDGKHRSAPSESIRREPFSADDA
jgi:hypothetical protein